MQGAQGVTALFMHEPITLTRVEIPTSRLNTLPSATQVTTSSSYSSSCYYICVLILLYICPRTTMCVSSHYYVVWARG